MQAALIQVDAEQQIAWVEAGELLRDSKLALLPDTTPAVQRTILANTGVPTDTVRDILNSRQYTLDVRLFCAQHHAHRLPPAELADIVNGYNVDLAVTVIEHAADSIPRRVLEEHAAPRGVRITM